MPEDPAVAREAEAHEHEWGFLDRASLTVSCRTCGDVGPTRDPLAAYLRDALLYACGGDQDVATSAMERRPVIPARADAGAFGDYPVSYERLRRIAMRVGELYTFCALDGPRGSCLACEARQDAEGFMEHKDGCEFADAHLLYFAASAERIGKLASDVAAEIKAAGR